MRSIEIHHTGFFSKKEHFVQRVQHLFLFFQLSGLRSMQAGGNKFEVDEPFCHLFFPGDQFEFDFDERRSNWVVQFSCADIELISASQFSFSGYGERIVLPRHLEVTSKDLPRWMNKFEALSASFAMPVPQERVLAQLYLLDILRYYIENVRQKSRKSPAAKLKDLIDNLENIPVPLTELSRKCGYSTDHLRLLFREKYEISPQEYKIRRVMTYAMELVSESELLISDIADKCGFKYLSHFSALFKKTYKMSPSEALKRFRYR